MCIDDRAAATRIAELVKADFPHAQLLVRAFDRGHAIALIKANVDYQIRETFESAMLFSRHAILALGATPTEADEAIAEVRRRDTERFSLEAAGGALAGRAVLLGNLEK